MIELSQNIIEYLTSLYGSEVANLYFEYIKKEHTSYIRINELTDTEEEIQGRLAAYGIELEKAEGIPWAYKVLKGTDILGKTLEYNTGKYYIQSLSSMIPPLVLSPTEKDVVLDLCSAPGSKATQIASLMKNRGTLITNEPQLDRIKMLIHNIDKLNIVNTGVIQFKGEWLSRRYNNYFDKVLVDAPCSALGVIQKKEEVSNWWSRERMEKIAFHQVMILTSALKMAKPGGEIVYSTCTMTPEENELIIDHMLSKYPVEVLDINVALKSHEGFTSYNGKSLNKDLNKARRILPWEVESEGFFVIKLRKTGEIEPSKPLELRSENQKIFEYRDKDIFKYLTEISDTFGIDEEIWRRYKYLQKGNDIFFINSNWSDSTPSFFTRIGTQLGTIDKRGSMHLHSFAAQYFKKELRHNVYKIDSEKDLKDYLSGGIIRAQVKTNEQQVISYKGLVLGTAAPVSNGLKSQYPKSKRIHEINYF
ncbi:MAG: RsmB/NOP family class I SAM-dependent RNA methyltransferase [Bacteroidota bacterium]|nr:RsmB/NOP family class I SAM-dependent RNA methyltransferase [Bacteroidota bacterium]